MEFFLALDKFKYRYGAGDRFSECKLEIWIDKKPHVIQTTAVVIASERGDNPGMSITNSYERFASACFASFLVKECPTENITWFEHYPSEGLNHSETFDLVTMKPAIGRLFSYPSWSPSSRLEVEMMVGGELKTI